jgi:hypothetical protein
MSLRGVNDVNVFNTHKFVDIVRKEDYALNKSYATLITIFLVSGG